MTRIEPARPAPLSMVSALMLAATIVLGCGCRSGGPSPGLELQKEDYGTARSHFQTRLVRQGPASQEWQPMVAPAGALQVVYSQNPHLSAWLSPADPQSGGSKRPAVLFLHGGFAIGADDWEMTQPFRDAGFVVMEPAVRSENGQSGSYSMFYDEVTDVLAAADYLARMPYVDPKRMFVAGHSVGGTLTLLAALSTDRFRAAASFSGSPDQDEWSRGQPQMVPFDPSDKQKFRMRSPIAFATGFKCPTRVLCGSEEAFFVDSSARMAEMAQKKGLDVAAIQSPGDHFSAVHEEMRRTIEFFRNKL